MATDHGGARSGAGRKPKPKIEQRAGKGIASEVLAMDGPPNHVRACGCDVCKLPRRNAKPKCECIFLDSEDGKGTKDKIKVECHFCRTRVEHAICHCEVCGWWEGLLAADRRLRFETRRYLTDRRDGKPAQGVFLGDTRENAPELEFDGILMPSADQSREAGKPN